MPHIFLGYERRSRIRAFGGQYVYEMIRGQHGPTWHSVLYDTNGGSGTPPAQDDVKEGQKFIVAGYTGALMRCERL